MHMHMHSEKENEKERFDDVFVIVPYTCVAPRGNLKTGSTAYSI
jgi:hypothetical protein